LYETFTDCSTLLEILFVAVDTAELSNKTTSWRRIRKCLLSKPLKLLVILVLLWRDNIVESFLFVLYQRQTVSPGLLNSWKKQEVCVINVRSDANVAVRTGEVFGAEREAVTRSPRKVCEFSTMDWDVNQHCMENMS
jgi:hypothetical protein